MPRIVYKVQRVISPKHPGDIFFKVFDSKDDFICKFYVGHETEANEYEQLMNSIVRQMEKQEDKELENYYINPEQPYA